MTISEIHEQVESAHQILYKMEEDEKNGIVTYVLQAHDRETLLEIIKVFEKNAEHSLFEIDRLRELKGDE